MHFGNYFGAVKNWVELQKKYECMYGVVDYHAMSMPYDPEELRKNTSNMVIDLLAWWYRSRKIDPLYPVIGTGAQQRTLLDTMGLLLFLRRIAAHDAVEGQIWER